MLVALRPRRLQALQRHLRPPGRRRAARAPRRRLAALPRRPRRAFRMGGDEFCALLAPGDRASPTPLVERRGRARSPSTARASRSAARYGAIVLPREASDAARGAADRRPADVRAEARRPHVGRAARARTCCCARSPSATPSCGDHLDGVAELAEATARRLGLGRRGGRARSATPPSCTTSARSRSPTRSSTSPGRSTRTSGTSSAATRSIGERIIAAAPALGRVAASSARATSAGTATATPTASRARRSRSARASSPSPTPSTR